MANETTKQENPAIQKNSGKSASNKAGKKRGGGRSRRGGRANSSSTRGNETLARMTVSTPVSQSVPSLIFPTDSASMMSAGNYITTAGQDNFIDDYNRVSNGTNLVPITVSAFAQARRTANIMRLNFMPQFGATGTSRSFINPLTQAALNLKQYIDTSFGTNTDYEPQDLMLYLMGVSACFPVIAEIKRDFRLLYTSIPNVYPAFVPRGVYEMLHLNDGNSSFSDGAGVMYTAEHLRSLIDKFNQVLLLFNQLPKPPEITAFGYNDDLFDALFADSPDITTAQLYVFASTGYWLYRDDYNEAGAGLVPRYWHGTAAQDPGKTVDEMITALYGQVRALSNLRTDSTAMLQNLFNAYGSKDTVQVPLFDINAIQPLPIVCDEHMLMAIENANICGTSVRMSCYARAATPASLGEAISGAPYVLVQDGEDVSPIFNLPLQFHKAADQVTKEDIGWALRFHSAFLSHENALVFDEAAGSEGDTREVLHCANSCGFAIITSFAIGRFNNQGRLAEVAYNTRKMPDTCYQLAYLEDFAAAPILVYYVQQGDPERVVHYDIGYYSGHRDVEVTYRLEDITMHWTYLTQAVWGANVNRNVTGSRR